MENNRDRRSDNASRKRGEQRGEKRDKNSVKNSVDALRLRMADLCARSEQCEYDILTKLLRAGAAQSEAAEIIDFLKQRKFLDNARYARAYANDKVRFAGWGRLKIRASLRAKRISDEDISAAMEQIDEEEYCEALMRVARAKAASVNLSDFRSRQKLLRSLASRGFEPSAAIRAIERLRRQEEEDED